MLFKNYIANTLLLACAATQVLASPVAHLHHAHKRDVVYVTDTVIVTLGGENTELASAPAATQTTISSQADGTYTAYAYSVATASSSDSSAESTAAVASTSTESTAAASSTASSDDSDFTAGSIGISYSPYNSDGTCRSLADIKVDFEKLTGYEIIRLYGVDCDQVQNVLQAKSSNQKLFVGIYFMDQIEAGVEEIASAVSTYGSWDDIYTVSVGNELVNDGEATVAQISEYVTTARTALTSAGYTGPVVSVDTHVAILNNPGLCDISDYMAFNAHAYWDGTVVASDAGPWLLLQMQRVSDACNQKHVMCVESGWPHQGEANGVAIPSAANLKLAISSIDETCGSDTLVFTAFDDLWKSAGSKGVEPYWGIY